METLSETGDGNHPLCNAQPARQRGPAPRSARARLSPPSQSDRERLLDRGGGIRLVAVLSTALARAAVQERAAEGAQRRRQPADILGPLHEALAVADLLVEPRH